ncbi:MAG: class I SAM-dependent methyltransferase [Sulfuricaulis sp.]|nr:class I SAM-dependent methyltransferase [Sulfuricaulis sp.]
MTPPYRNLLLGGGHDHRKKMHHRTEPDWQGELIVLDMNPNCGADVIWDMEDRPLPFPDAHFDEIHAYDCLEHWGRQGDWRGWFDEAAEYHRLLKPGGTMSIVVPMGADYFADPGHTRFFEPNHFRFLNQAWYEERLAAGAQITDYRWYWKLDFEVPYVHQMGDPVHHLAVLLRKPGA